MSTLLEVVHSVPHDFLPDNTDAGDALLRHPRSSPENDEPRIANSQSSDKSTVRFEMKDRMGICREAHGRTWGWSVSH